MTDRKMPELSHDAKEDPAGTVSLIEEYIDRLRGPYRKYQKRVVEITRRSRITLSAAKPEHTTRTTHETAPPVIINYEMYQAALGEAGSEFMDELDEMTPEIVRMAYQQGTTYGSIQLRAVGIPAGDTLLPTDNPIVSILVQRYLGDLQGFTDKVSADVNREIATGILQGEGSYAMAERVETVLDSSFSRAESIARTESMYALNQGTLIKFRRNGIEKVERVEAYDDRTCDECAEADGRVYTLEESEGVLPAHPGCRGTWRPVITWEEEED